MAILKNCVLIMEFFQAWFLILHCKKKDFRLLLQKFYCKWQLKLVMYYGILKFPKKCNKLFSLELAHL